MSIPVFDGHCDTISRIARVPGRHLDAHTGQWNLTKMEKAGPRAQFFALFHYPKLPGSKRAALERLLGTFQSECALYPDRVVHCRTAREARAAAKEHKLAAFLSVEGAELLECSQKRLEWAWAQGVRAVNLTWNVPNELSGTNAHDQDRGLSRKGVDFVRRMNELGVLVDVSHLSDAGFWDVARVSQKPFVATHSNSRAVFSHPRNLTDDEFTAIIDAGGVAGLNCYADFLGPHRVTMETLLRHLEHFLDLGGEHSVCLGGDWDGCERLPEGMEGAWNWLDFYHYLSGRGYDEDLLEGLFYSNLMRVVDTVCTT